MHKDRFKEGLVKYGPGHIFAFGIKETWDYHMNGPTHAVHCVVVESENGYHAIPRTQHDVETALDWETRYRRIPDSELATN